MPLSRQGADAVFDKVDAHLEIDQALPSDFFVNFYASGQDSFGRALLTSEQFDIDGSRMLSGFTAGARPATSPGSPAANSGTASRRNRHMAAWS